MGVQGRRTASRVEVLHIILLVLEARIHQNWVGELLDGLVGVILNDLIAIIYREARDIVIDHVGVGVAVIHTSIQKGVAFLNYSIPSNPLVLLYCLQVLTGPALRGKFPLT